MKLDLYQIDAFANHCFEGNPAAVVPLQEWLDDALMQSIAAENNLAETAFYVAEQSGLRIRWFTPEVEVNLCGHATLAAAYVLFEELQHDQPELIFTSRSGELKVTRDDDRFVLDFPVQECHPCKPPVGLSQALGCEIKQCLKNEDYLVHVESHQLLADLTPDFTALANLDLRGVVVTAPSKQFDFVNRFFAPNVGINEDPVTGSAYTKLIPYWAKLLGKDVMIAKQISQRGGEVFCELADNRVLISGAAVKYMQGTIEV